MGVNMLYVDVPNYILFGCSVASFPGPRHFWYRKSRGPGNEARCSVRPYVLQVGTRVCMSHRLEPPRQGGDCDTCPPLASHCSGVLAWRERELLCDKVWMMRASGYKP